MTAAAALARLSTASRSSKDESCDLSIVRDRCTDPWFLASCEKAP